MATLTIGQGASEGEGFTLHDVYLQNWIRTTASATAQTFSSGDYKLVLEGSFDSAAKGTVNGFSVYQGAEAVYRELGFASYDAAPFVDFILNKVDTGVLFEAMTSGNDMATGSALNDIISTGAGDDHITAGGGYDSIFAGTGSDIVDGGDGYDYADAGGPLSDFRVERAGDAFILTSLKDGSVDTYKNVERISVGLQFIAADISVDNFGGQVFRMYQAAFDRAPDQLGLAFWMEHLSKDATLDQMANGFIDSAEYRQRYGDGVSNHDLVAKYYDNVLHRAADQGGLDFWTTQLDSGSATKAQVLAAISESHENLENSAAIIAQGVVIDYILTV
jgi:hypothetical protein